MSRTGIFPNLAAVAAIPGEVRREDGSREGDEGFFAAVAAIPGEVRRQIIAQSSAELAGRSRRDSGGSEADPG